MGIADYLPLMSGDQVVRALAALEESVQRVRVTLDAVERRAAVVKADRSAGRPMREIVTKEKQPLLVELLTDVLDDLAANGAAFRRAEARALHEEGLSQGAIAALFGVSRQRIAALLAAPRSG